MKQYLSKSAIETKAIGGKLAKQIPHGVIALIGELGAGKTVFVQGFAQGLGIKEKIISPTYVLIKQHRIPSSSKLLYHVDLYRLDDKTKFKDLGLKESFASDSLVLIEWAEKIEEFLPKNTIKIFLEKTDENNRKIVIE